MNFKKMPCTKNCESCSKEKSELREILDLNSRDKAVLICNSGNYKIFRILRVAEGRMSISNRRIAIAKAMAEKEKQGVVVCI